jgi:uncharacterized protein (TIGR03435 family)
MTGDPPPAAKSSPGRLSLSCQPLPLLIQGAYDIFATGEVSPLNPNAPLTPIEGQPDWVNFSKYTIDARADQPQSMPMMRGPMMRALLEERFRLKVHRESREVPVYALTVDKNGIGPSLRTTKDGVSATDEDMMTPRVFTHGEVWCGDGRVSRKENLTIYDVRGISLGVFAKYLRLDRPVIDRTGLTGTFDIHLEWPPDPPDLPNQAAMSAIREMLGLRLVPQKGPREFLVVDHVEKPSGN